MKKLDSKIVALTCYDYSMARFLDEAGVDILLVGDSLAMVMMGEKDTKNIKIEDMIPFALGVFRGTKKAKVIFDMPVGSYETANEALENVELVQQKTGIKIFKIEGRPDIVEALTKKGIEVMGHTGLKPQTAEKNAVVGRSTQEWEAVESEAIAIEQAGAKWIVLECVPVNLAQQITNKLLVPTIGIGAGLHCDGQILVLYDMVNLYQEIQPKFVRHYANLGDELKKAVIEFVKDVKGEQFPLNKESFL